MNILFIFADQMHRFAMGCMGNPDVRTPNLDRLAAVGTLFTGAYSSCPICGPFRISLLTGQYTSQTNTFGNGNAIPPGAPSLAGELEAAGLRTSYVGKWHIGGAGNQPIPVELRGGFTDFIGYQCYNGFHDNVCFYDEANREHRFDRHRTEVTTDLAVERLGRVADRPFAMFVSYQAPHYPVQPADEYEAMYAGRPVHRRANSQDVEPYTPTFSPPSPRPIENCPDYQRYGGNLDAYIRLYNAMVTQVDANVGRLLAALVERGVDDRTVVIFTSDHGDMQGSHGLRNKCHPHEESSGIPLIVRAPGAPTGRRSDGPVCSVDFYRTCLDFAGAPAPSSAVEGVSIAPTVRGLPQLLDGPVFSEFKSWAMVRLGALKLVVARPDLTPTHLFDLATDPYELNNLVETPEHAADLMRLLAVVREWNARVQEHPC